MIPTEQDKRMIELLADGHTQAGVAEETGLSISVVTTRIQYLHTEYGTHTAAALVATALRKGVIR